MMMPSVNWLAVLAAGIVIFMLGGLWYSPLLFAKKWIALQGKTEEELRAQSVGSNMTLNYISAFICGLITAWVMAMFLAHSGFKGWMGGAHLGAAVWLGFAAPTSYATSVFYMKPKQAWLIDSMYNLVAFVLAGIVLGAWA